MAMTYIKWTLKQKFLVDTKKEQVTSQGNSNKHMKKSAGSQHGEHRQWERS